MNRENIFSSLEEDFIDNEIKTDNELRNKKKTLQKKLKKKLKKNLPFHYLKQIIAKTAF
jgi:hypothetical protein